MAKMDIIITHFVNPHMFWFRVNNDFFGEKSRTKMEDEMQKQVPLCPQYEPRIGDKVAVYKVNDKRWIRAVVDEVLNGNDRYVLWEIDYGQPLLSTADLIRKLPNMFAEMEPNVIKFGGLNEIVPGHLTYDPKEGKTTVKIVEKWTDAANKLVTDILDNAFCCEFIIDSENDNQFFGQLKITTNLKQDINLQEKLIELSYGVLEKDDFFKIINKSRKTDRWLDPNDNSKLFKYDNNIRSTITMTSPLKVTKQILDDECKDEKIVENEMPDIAITKKVEEWHKTNVNYHSAQPNGSSIDLTAINIEEKLFDIESVSVIGQDRTLHSIRNLKFDNERESSKSPPCLGDLENNLKILVIEDKITESKKNVDDLTVSPKNIEMEKSRDANDNKSVVSIGSTSSRLSSSQLKRLMLAKSSPTAMPRISCTDGFDISKIKMQPITTQLEENIEKNKTTQQELQPKATDQKCQILNSSQMPKILEINKNENIKKVNIYPQTEIERPKNVAENCKTIELANIDKRIIRNELNSIRKEKIDSIRPFSAKLLKPDSINVAPIKSIPKNTGAIKRPQSYQKRVEMCRSERPIIPPDERLVEFNDVW